MDYEEILLQMNEAFKEKSGYTPHLSSVDGIQIQILAGEIYALSKSLDWIKDQAFLTTASGEYLDRHALDRSIEKKPAVVAQGTLLFNRAEAASYDLAIPTGTLCAISGDAQAQYQTTKPSIIRAGSTEGFAYAESVNGGKIYNAAPNTITTLITSPEGIISVTNPEAFYGGEDEENIESYRERVIATMSDISNGTNYAFFKTIAENFDGVFSASIYRDDEDPTHIYVYVWGKDSAVPSATISELEALLKSYREINTTIDVVSATQRTVDVPIGVKINKGFDTVTVLDHCKTLVTDYINNLKVGEDLYISSLTKLLLENAEIYTTKTSAYLNDFLAAVSEVLVPGHISITSTL